MDRDPIPATIADDLDQDDTDRYKAHGPSTARYFYTHSAAKAYVELMVFNHIREHLNG